MADDERTGLIDYAIVGQLLARPEDASSDQRRSIERIGQFASGLARTLIDHVHAAP